MATGGCGDLERSLDKMLDYLCSICKKHNKNVEAEKFCKDCKAYYCTNCVKIHEQVKCINHHKIVDKSQFPLGSSVVFQRRPHGHKPVDSCLLFKMLITGESGVGKTSLLIRYNDDQFSDYFNSTLGVDFKVRTIEMGGKVIKLNISDTAGHERFRTIIKPYYRGAHGVLLVFDITNLTSFKKLQYWIDAVQEFGENQVAKLLVGNRSDLTDKRAVSYEMAQEFANKMGIPYLETSAKTAINVEQAFMTLTAEMINMYDSGAFKRPITPTINLKDDHDVTRRNRSRCSC